MMSLALIQEIAHENAVRAAEEYLTPFVYATDAEVDASFPFPFLGDYVPEGWELAGEHFVDSSGWGTVGEPALSAEQFRAVINNARREHAAKRETVGWGITQAGQFQVYVGEFVRPVKGD